MDYLIFWGSGFSHLSSIFCEFVVKVLVRAGFISGVQIGEGVTSKLADIVTRTAQWTLAGYWLETAFIRLSAQLLRQ